MVSVRAEFFHHIYLINVYLDDLSIALSACRTGCSIGNSLINHLMYADDLVICSPSSISLRALISVCEEYAVIAIRWYLITIRV